MMTALETHDKLKFITGEIEVPAADSQMHKQWKKVNSTLVSWILNAMSKELVRGFVFASDDSELWNEIREGFGVSNGPKIYELRRGIYSTKQGSDSIVGYYNKIKRL
ncbi:hypothetical protein LIER_06198 [Lithospermum erythrorhizon]|uniref:Retrotransposon gag domain-containing protein n=1 Tax=Lithospermum erythrorhizon TaxID=34254 RepID=A0AAV3P3P0_LITER